MVLVKIPEEWARQSDIKDKKMAAVEKVFRTVGPSGSQ